MGLHKYLYHITKEPAVGLHILNELSNQSAAPLLVICVQHFWPQHWWQQVHICHIYWQYFSDWCTLRNLYLWHLIIYLMLDMYGSNEVIKCCVLLFLDGLAVMWGVYVDYSRSRLWHIYAVWQPYLLRGKCQYCEVYVY